MYHEPSIPIFILTFSAGVVLTLVTFSVPFIKPFYFLHSSVAGGITYGIWGWCLDVNGSCSPKQFGYREDPEIVPILLKLHVLFPIAAGLALLSSVTLIPVMCSSARGLYPFPLFVILSTLACISSLTGFAICIATWLIALHRFHADGFEASLGPLVWMALAGTALLLFVALNAGCSMMWKRGHRRSFIYTY
ncbi:hypothetical protein QCA50_005518 [Cerrena zonata]|uniref:Pali-domain-containing protein n=1 Tax=Cerrena zonata TaxID=2478898 RepID=A0AAW0GLF6_9APHY